MIRFKTIRPNGKKALLHRLSIKLPGGGSLKIHIIVDDDKGPLHTHPWNFRSLLLIPYKEDIEYTNIAGYPDEITIDRGWLSVVRKGCNEKHRTKLYRLFGRKIPALTIGIYGKKTQLCSFCKELGYCKQSKPI